MSVIVASIIDEETNERLAKVTATSWYELTREMESLIVAAHAALPKSKLKFQLDGEPEFDQSKHFKARCLHPSCDRAKVQLEDKIPIELVGMMTLIFHTAHEGHPMEVTFDGRTWRSPVSPGQKVAD